MSTYTIENNNRLHILIDFNSSKLKKKEIAEHRVLLKKINGKKPL